MAMLNRAFPIAILAIAVTFIYSFLSKETINLDRKDQIEGMISRAWNDYSDNGWGFDIYKPMSHKNKNMPRSDDPLGWFIVDSIDTLMITYNLTTNLETKKEFLQHIEKVEHWIDKTLDYDIDAEINIFETTIRMVGGLLSGYYYSKELNVGNPEIYLKKAIDLADRLIPAFNRTETGIPYSSINLKTGMTIRNHVDNGASSTAEFTTLQMEFKYLSAITGDDKYWKLSEKVYPTLYKNNNILETYDGLVPIYTFPDTGYFYGENIRFGSRGDSFYEYLLKQYLLTHERLYYDLYRSSIEGMKKHLVKKSKPSGYTYIAEKPWGLHAGTDPKMDHLVCFMGGLLAMGATEGHDINSARKMPFWDTIREEDWHLAQEFTHTCYQMYHQTPSGLSPEIVVFNDGSFSDQEKIGWWESPTGDFFIKPLDKHNLQRPETVESLMFLYHLSKDDKYRVWGAEILDNFERNSCINCDSENKTYTSLDNCVELPTLKRDNVESFWIAETLKYLYLLFQNDVDLTRTVFNTEAHPFPVLSPELLKETNLTTGWSL